MRYWPMGSQTNFRPWEAQVHPQPTMRSKKVVRTSRSKVTVFNAYQSRRPNSIPLLVLEAHLLRDCWRFITPVWRRSALLRPLQCRMTLLTSLMMSLHLGNNRGSRRRYQVYHGSKTIFRSCPSLLWFAVRPFLPTTNTCRVPSFQQLIYSLNGSLGPKDLDQILFQEARE